MSAYVEAIGDQRVVLSGYLTERRADGTYAAPLIPQLFFGVAGTQLQTWRQYLPTTGNQVILSRSGGQPSVPREDLWWRKVADTQVQKETKTETAPIVKLETPSWILPVAVLTAVLVGGFIVYKIAK